MPDCQKVRAQPWNRARTACYSSSTLLGTPKHRVQVPLASNKALFYFERRQEVDQPNLSTLGNRSQVLFPVSCPISTF
ncbi:hypothetical protein BDZ89DRAFT_1069114, partial [Hymenopellis radicata]